MATTTMPTVEELQAEIERLRSELSAKTASDATRQTAKNDQDDIAAAATETNNAALDQIFRLVQSSNAATAELLRAGSDILVKLNEDVCANGRTNQDDLPKTLLTRLPADIQKAYLRAIASAIEVPGRMAQEFTNTHRDTAKS